MKIDSPFIFLQRDYLSLECLADGKDVFICDVKRRLYLNQRNVNFKVPNNFFKLEDNAAFNEINTFSDLFLEFQIFTKDFLFAKDNKIYVKDEKFLEWHNAISFVSPLLMISSFIENQFELQDFKNYTISDYFKNFIFPNTKSTALISPECIALQHFFTEKHGFYDLHIHLNGIVEADGVWQNLLIDIEKNINEINSEFSKPNSLKELLEQKGLSFVPSDLRELLYKARELKGKIFNIILGLNTNEPSEFYISPFTLFFNELSDAKIPATLLKYESLMYVCVFRFIKNGSVNSELVAKKFYEYLLIQGLFSDFLTQNKNQFGFQQFQEITKTNLREESDKKQISKFFQLCGNDENLPNFKFAEFRFSPKESTAKNVQLIRQIESSWKKFSVDCEYNLIAHFIKKPPKENDADIYFSLRKELDKKTNALIGVKNLKSELSKRLTAIDAASSEFDAPPEIFAPYFRKLRKNGISHFTYHAGEDFYHVLSGLRAIYETVEFCGLQKGDRIGHATAGGINIDAWYSNMKDNFCISKPEWLDNLVFAVTFITERKLESLYNIIPLVTFNIEKLASDIYEENISFLQLKQLWLNLKFSFDEQKEKLPQFKTFIDYRYSKEYLHKQNKEILRSYDIEYLSVETLNIIQTEILKYLHEKEIVIETLPTSNFRIGFYDDFALYQLFNWFTLFLDEKTIPPIVIGTDDPGIFSTNIFNEYALVYCYLVYSKKMERNKVINFISILYRNAEIYAFRDD